MFGRTKQQNDAQTLLKESLLRQVSHSVKQIQLEHSQTGEIFNTQEATSQLITVLEAIFLHGLKRSLFESALRSVSVEEDTRPTPSFYAAVLPVTHKDIQKRVAGLQQIKTNIGMGRAWLRLALNDGLVSSYLTAMMADRRCTKHYRPTAFLRDKETLDTAGGLLDGLQQIPFEIPLNSSLLNTWQSEPLLLSGLWMPAMRVAVHTAVDVASGIEDEEEPSLLLTASSSMRSLLTLDDSQALQLILDTPMLQEHEELPEEEEEKVASEDKANDVRLMERSFSTLLRSASLDESMTQENNEQQDDEESKQEELLPETAENDEIARPAPSILRRKHETEFADLLSSSSELEEEKNRLAEQWEIVENKQRKKEERLSLEEVVLRIARERGLKEQGFECPDCRLSVGLDFGGAYLCHVTGEYLCEQCHGGQMSVVPSRLIFNWDHTKYPVGTRARAHLTSIMHEPMIDLQQVNSKLYSAVTVMKTILTLRRQLNLLHVYLSTCKQGMELGVRSYLLETTHLYSLFDLLSVPGGGLETELGKIVADARGHVTNCWVCSQKGFICELCRDQKVIYPFDFGGSVYRCSKCHAVYHGSCLTQGRACPKCQRRKDRLAQIS